MGISKKENAVKTVQARSFPAFFLFSRLFRIRLAALLPARGRGSPSAFRNECPPWKMFVFCILHSPSAEKFGSLKSCFGSGYSMQLAVSVRAVQANQTAPLCKGRCPEGAEGLTFFNSFLVLSFPVQA